MAAKALPASPSLEQYKKQAKELFKGRTSGDPDAMRRIRHHHARLGKLSEPELRRAPFALADAQLVVAREHGFESWPRFKKHLSALAREGSPDAVWTRAQNALLAGDATTLDRLLREHEQLFRERTPPPYRADRGSLAPDYSHGLDARSLIIRNHHFENWDTWVECLEARKHENSPIARFETAVDAIVSGDVPALERLLRAHPDLIRARSTRTHHATLLHYVGANGVEDFRQRTPKNAVAIAKVLLGAGAEVDAAADMYGGGSTTIGLVATSIHPLLAGVQDALVETLMEAGANIDGPDAVNGCLANGCQQAAEFLATRGAPLDLEGAAGVGRLDLVKTFFNEDGTLRTGATSAKMSRGFTWACEYGRADVVGFLLDRGVGVATTIEPHGQTGLHWAAYGAHAGTVRLLLDRKAPVNARDERFDETPLGWALHRWGELPDEAMRARYFEVVALLVAAGATANPAWLNERVRADPGMLAALGGAMSSDRA